MVSKPRRRAVETAENRTLPICVDCSPVKACSQRGVTVPRSEQLSTDNHDFRSRGFPGLRGIDANRRTSSASRSHIVGCNRRPRMRPSFAHLVTSRDVTFRILAASAVVIVSLNGLPWLLRAIILPSVQLSNKRTPTVDKTAACVAAHRIGRCRRGARLAVNYRASTRGRSRRLLAGYFVR